MKYAYVTTLYGNNVYITGAIVLGYTLMMTKTKIDRVIMVTPDVGLENCKILSNFYTHIIPIDYLQVDNSFYLEDTRFRDVFTKLKCFELVQYDKIILMDLDMVVQHNIDHLFKLQPPAACLKKYHIGYGKPIPDKMICQNNKLIGSINAGLMLLKPDLREWKNMKSLLQNNEKLYKFRYPEQDFLSLYYCKMWTSITFNYNYQFGLTARTRKYNYSDKNIYVVHYSSSYKPWNKFIKVIDDNEEKFIQQHIKYYDLWNKIYNEIKEKYHDLHISY